MNRILKIHCSSLGKIMTEPRSAKAKEAGELSETAKSEILKIWIEDNYGKYKEYSSKYTDKGNHCEERGITVFGKYIKMMVEKGEWKHSVPLVLMKNSKRYYDDFFEGTPDVNEDEDDFLADIKCPYSLENFILATDDDYMEQLQGYMKLTGKKKALLVYCLLDAPEWLIEKEIYYTQQKASPDMADEIAEAVRRNMTFDNVPDDKKVKVFEIAYDQAYVKKMQDRVVKAREYYNKITL